VLGRFTREKGVLELTDAIRKMTAEPARRLGLTDRGVVRVGTIADLVVFDPETVIDNADFGQPPAAPTGIDVVLVDGTVMLQDGAISSERPGRVLLREG
jgi:N-acyl-D-amino-acid deacylase